MTQKASGNEYRTTILCIDSYKNRNLKGRFYNPYFPAGKAFQSATEFLAEMEQALNTMDFPQPFASIRSFAEPTDLSTGPPELHSSTGKKATFALKILFRQNASWQGSVSWLEGKQEQSFRSVLELFLLMDSALIQQQATT